MDLQHRPFANIQHLPFPISPFNTVRKDAPTTSADTLGAAVASTQLIVVTIPH
jgi:hypothetical protein